MCSRTPRRSSPTDRRVALRAPLSGLPGLTAAPGTVAVLVALIGTTSYDGLSRGTLWTKLVPDLGRAWSDLGIGTPFGTELTGTIGLVVALSLVAGVYRIGVSGMVRMSRGAEGAMLGARFAHTLVPIAVAYVVAHYFSLVALQGQALASLASDPLGNGANIFGTASDQRELRDCCRPGRSGPCRSSRSSPATSAASCSRTTAPSRRTTTTAAPCARSATCSSSWSASRASGSGCCRAPEPRPPYAAGVSAIVVRRAEKDDVPAIAGVHVRAWRTAYRGLVHDAVLDDLSVAERERMWSGAVPRPRRRARHDGRRDRRRGRRILHRRHALARRRRAAGHGRDPGDLRRPRAGAARHRRRAARAALSRLEHARLAAASRSG